ncbi:MAG TPA: hypothetical protein VN829_01555 [Dongiaceae bacterium]|nr:hypothetical protein [Dongiaceae bacterium]
MAQLNSTSVTGKVSATVAASNPMDLMRKQEVDASLAGKASLSHTHATGDIPALASAILEAVGSWVGQLVGDLDWQGLSGVLIRLDPAGGLLHAAGGLAVDAGMVSLPGHHHAASDVDDLSNVVTALLLDVLVDSDTFQWVRDSGVAGQVRVKSQAGLTSSLAGLAVDFGIGPAQAATGDHTHTQLHDPLTLGESRSLRFNLAGQVLSAEVMLAEGGGLLAGDSGVAVDFGPGATQAAAGNHTHSPSSIFADPTEWASDWLGDSATVAWSRPAPGVLTPSVKLDLSTGSGHAPLGQSGSGLYVALGSGVAQAAPGNHSHSAATPTTAGFMSAADKAKLDLLAWSGVINQTMEFTAGLNPALQFDTNGSPWNVSATDSLWTVGLGAPILTVNNNNGIVVAADVKMGGSLYISGTKVVGNRQGAVANAAVLSPWASSGNPYYPTNNGWGFSSSQHMTDFLGQVQGAIAQLNSLLAAVRAHGLIAS